MTSFACTAAAGAWKPFPQQRVIADVVTAPIVTAWLLRRDRGLHYQTRPEMALAQMKLGRDSSVAPFRQEQRRQHETGMSSLSAAARALPRRVMLMLWRLSGADAGKSTAVWRLYPCISGDMVMDPTLAIRREQ